MANSWIFPHTVEAFTKDFNYDTGTLHANTLGILDKLNANIRNLTNNLHQSQTSNT